MRRRGIEVYPTDSKCPGAVVFEGGKKVDELVVMIISGNGAMANPKYAVIVLAKGHERYRVTLIDSVRDFAGAERAAAIASFTYLRMEGAMNLAFKLSGESDPVSVVQRMRKNVYSKPLVVQAEQVVH